MPTVAPPPFKAPKIEGLGKPTRSDVGRMFGKAHKNLITYMGQLVAEDFETKSDRSPKVEDQLRGILGVAKDAGAKRLLIIYFGKLQQLYRTMAQKVAQDAGIEVIIKPRKFPSIGGTEDVQKTVYVILGEADDPDKLLKAYERDIRREH